MTAIRDGDWRLFSYDHATQRSVWVTYDERGSQVFRIDTPADAMIEENADARNASEGQRFGDWARVASVPLNHFWHSGLAEAMRQGDQTFLSRWLNDGDNRAFRTFRGNV